MPKTLINYNNTIIYKLCCNDPTITDIYIGHTTNFTKRKQQHKINCNNLKGKEYNNYKYYFIRNNGGWDNWSMIEIIKIKCCDIYDACRVERKYIEQLNATLNINRPIISEIEKNLLRNQKKGIDDKLKHFLNKNKISNFLNMVNIINFKQDDNYNLEWSLEQIKLIKTLIIDLGYKNIYDRETKINNSELLERMAYIKSNYTDIFEKRTIKQKCNIIHTNENIFKSTRSFLGFINSLFTIYGFKIIRKEQKIDGLRIYFYRLEFINEIIQIINDL